MLNFIFLKKKSQNFIKNNGLVDFFLKRVSFMYVYNVYIHLAFFFSEKYLIEFTTKYVFNWIVLNSFTVVKKLQWSNLYVYLYLICLNIFLMVL